MFSKIRPKKYQSIFVMSIKFYNKKITPNEITNIYIKKIINFVFVFDTNGFGMCSLRKDS